MTESAPAIISRDGSGWFERMCAEKGLAPVEPMRAEELEPGVVLFTVMGDPRIIESVRLFSLTISIRYVGDHWRDVWQRDELISLVARRRTDGET